MRGDLRGVEVIGPDLSLKEVMGAVPAMGKLLVRLVRDDRVPLSRKLLLAAAAAYVFSPVDFFPDFLPILGHLDDLALVMLVFEKLVLETDDEVLFELWEGDPSVLARMLKVARSSPRDLRMAVLGGFRRAARTSSQR